MAKPNIPDELLRDYEQTTPTRRALDFDQQPKPAPPSEGQAFASRDSPHELERCSACQHPEHLHNPACFADLSKNDRPFRDKEYPWTGRSHAQLRKVKKMCWCPEFTADPSRARELILQAGDHKAIAHLSHREYLESHSTVTDSGKRSTKTSLDAFDQLAGKLFYEELEKSARLPIPTNALLCIADALDAQGYKLLDHLEPKGRAALVEYNQKHSLKAIKIWRTAAQTLNAPVKGAVRHRLARAAEKYRRNLSAAVPGQVF